MGGETGRSVRLGPRIGGSIPSAPSCHRGWCLQSRTLRHRGMLVSGCGDPWAMPLPRGYPYLRRPRMPCGAQEAKLAAALCGMGLGRCPHLKGVLKGGRAGGGSGAPTPLGWGTLQCAAGVLGSAGAPGPFRGSVHGAVAQLSLEPHDRDGLLPKEGSAPAMGGLHGLPTDRASGIISACEQPSGTWSRQTADQVCFPWPWAPARRLGFC